MANPLASVVKALGGGIKSQKSNIHVPQFGPTVTKPLVPGPMSIGSTPVAASVKDILSRPSRSRRSGYKKTAPEANIKTKGANLSKIPGLGPGDSTGGTSSLGAY